MSRSRYFGTGRYRYRYQIAGTGTGTTLVPAGTGTGTFLIFFKYWISGCEMPYNSPRRRPRCKKPLIKRIEVANSFINISTRLAATLLGFLTKKILRLSFFSKFGVKFLKKITYIYIYIYIYTPIFVLEVLSGLETR